ncbi:tRNA threonylcarbamoyladenosine biosynthesis protein TsaB [Mariniphaga anaerophila]|uniref:tRNA threonylcarbamoyladenosine biosynthesis protein TsaB n=1 Tax=Mariniphaga anaerophila TaxID=1484053 RepID=A0A1M5BIW5_9BACT|nr:tRNA (adenosine(37)-N6)-threonylcarbamoyltransferase complex dimerization subunit type 1 TsaB [Mariniphaga anaerophila]SHF42494.1 tRNA threonylcarbamoyladenosine biosynthesis protein TsaB [Mariniphaga anaerophila]
MATILNIETATEVCSVNLARDGKVLFEKESREGLNHSQLLTVFIEEIFKSEGFEKDQLDAVAVSKGPGSYTGLRIGVSVAKGLCYSLGKPLIAIGTLDALGRYAAQNKEEFLPDFVNGKDALFCPMIDARRMEVYTALFNANGEKIEPVAAKIIDENSFRENLDQHPVLFFGNGAEKCKTALTHANALFLGPQKASARFMVNLAEEKYNKNDFEDVAYFEPFYLKNFIATIPKNKIIQ